MNQILIAREIAPRSTAHADYQLGSMLRINAGPYRNSMIPFDNLAIEIEHARTRGKGQQQRLLMLLVSQEVYNKVHAQANFPAHVLAEEYTRPQDEDVRAADMDHSYSLAESEVLHIIGELQLNEAGQVVGVTMNDQAVSGDRDKSMVQRIQDKVAKLSTVSDREQTQKARLSPSAVNLYEDDAIEDVAIDDVADDRSKMEVEIELSKLRDEHETLQKKFKELEVLNGILTEEHARDVSILDSNRKTIDKALAELKALKSGANQSVKTASQFATGYQTDASLQERLETLEQVNAMQQMELDELRNKPQAKQTPQPSTIQAEYRTRIKAQFIKRMTNAGLTVVGLCVLAALSAGIASLITVVSPYIMLSLLLAASVSLGALVIMRAMNTSRIDTNSNKRVQQDLFEPQDNQTSNIGEKIMLRSPTSVDAKEQKTSDLDQKKKFLSQRSGERAQRSYRQ